MPNEPSSAQTEFFHELSAEKLVERAVRNCRDHCARKGVKHPRWVAVMDCFVLGSTYAHDLCRKFGLDPDEMVKR